MSWRHGLAQTRNNWRRLLGAAVAVALGAAFVTATLLTAAMVRSAADALVTASVGDADAVVLPNMIGPDQVDISELPSATSSEMALGLDVLLRSDAGLRTSFAGTLGNQELLEVAEGRLATAPGEIAIPDLLAEQLGISVGDTVTVDALQTWMANPVPAETPVDMTVTGTIVSTPSEAFMAPPLLMTAEGVTAVAAEAGLEPRVVAVFLTTDDLDSLREEADAAAWVGGMNTRNELADAMIGGYTGTSSTITNFTLAFVAIALVVSALVVSTTFQVLIAQRVTVLGLLRTAGATRRQVASSVFSEALAVGLAGGVVGVLVGHLLAAVLVLVARRVELPVEWASAIPFAPEAIVIPLAVAILVTFISAFLPAIEASRVPPLAAVQAASAPRSRRTPVGFGVVLLLLGAVSAGSSAALTGMIQAQQGYIENSMPILVAAGAGVLAMIAGITLITPVLFPRVNEMLGRVAHALSPRQQRPTALLARRALASNRRRAIGTSNALLVGVTLVAMLGTGAASARESLTSLAMSNLPTDIVVEAWDPAAAHFDPAVVDELRAIPGVEAVAPMAQIAVGITLGPMGMDGTLLGVDPADMAAASYDERFTEALQDGVIISDQMIPATDGSEVTVRHATWPPADPATGVMSDPVYGDPVSFTVRQVSTGQWEFMTTMDSLAALDPDAPISRIWISAPNADLEVVAREVERISTLTDENGNTMTSVSQPGAERASLNSTINTVVTLATSLLAISIVIALLGVTNTLSLSVVERRREFAMLRSVGMTTRQVRSSLMLEGFIMAMSATLVGILLGVLFGLAGAAVLFPNGGAHLTVPWTLLASILAVAVIAGPLASILPGRLATKGSPVAAIGS